MYILITKITNFRRGFVVNKNTTITIEGFPRSANTFSKRAFLMAQANKLNALNFKEPKEFGKKYGYNIATHLHSSPQVIQSVKLEKPTLVLIRNPKDSIISMKAREIQTSNDPKLAHYTIRPLIKYYIQFYNAIMPYKDNIVIGKFENVTKDFGEIIRKINKKFNTDFGEFKYTEYNMKMIKGNRNHILPDSERNKIKDDVKKEIEEHKDLLKKADSIYKEFIS
ncbi:MAG: hypothetical protein ACQESP_11020 [Candidatus Muiribacteriota bacterium]